MLFNLENFENIEAGDIIVFNLKRKFINTNLIEYDQGIFYIVKITNEKSLNLNIAVKTKYITYWDSNLNQITKKSFAYIYIWLIGESINPHIFKRKKLI